MRWSWDTEALRETPLGSPPSNARERRKVVRLESAWAKAVPAGRMTAHRSEAASIRRAPCMLFLIGTGRHALSGPRRGLDVSCRAGLRVRQPAQAPVLTGERPLASAAR